ERTGGGWRGGGLRVETTGVRTMTEPAYERLVIDSFADLITHEPQILRRIGDVPNGGHLFLVHPFLLLEEVGVDLSDAARREILDREPQLRSLSPVPYRALLRRNAPHPNFHLRLHPSFR